jgi:hypothetical protein
MLGERDPQKQLWSYQINLDKRGCAVIIRYGELTRRLDLEFVRPEVARFYRTKGNVSGDPVVMLLLFLDNVRRERELVQVIPERLDYMWFWVTAWMTRFPITEYVTKRGVCLSCRLRKFCTRSRTRRTMHRHRDQKLLVPMLLVLKRRFRSRKRLFFQGMNHETRAENRSPTSLAFSRVILRPG